jgi:hypothetical protein
MAITALRKFWSLMRMSSLARVDTAAMTLHSTLRFSRSLSMASAASYGIFAASPWT